MEENIRSAMSVDVKKKALELYEIDETKIKDLDGFENFVYEYEKEGNSYIIRFVHSSHRTSELVLAEIEFIDFLYKNNSNVSQVVKSEKDNVCETIGTENNEYFTVTSFIKAKGDFVKKEDIDELFNYKFGRAVGKLHLLTKTFSPKNMRQHWYEEDLIGIGRRNLNEEDMFVIDKTEELIEKLKKLPRGINEYGLIHTDLHFGNIYYDGEDFTFFDFDDSSYKHFISDIAIIIFYQFGLSSANDEEREKRTYVFLQDFCKGYLEVNDLDYSWFDHLNDFLKLRELILYMVLFGAGEEIINSPWGQKYVAHYRNRIKNDIPFFDYKKAIGIK